MKACLEGTTVMSTHVVECVSINNGTWRHMRNEQTLVMNLVEFRNNIEI